MRNNFWVCYLIPSDVVCILSRPRPYKKFLKNSWILFQVSGTSSSSFIAICYVNFFKRILKYTQNGRLLEIIGRRRPSMQTLNMQVHWKIWNYWKYSILRGKYKLRSLSEIIWKTTKLTTSCSSRKSDYRMEICTILTFRWITNNFIVDVTLNN